MDWSTHFPTFFQAPPAEGEGSVNLKGKKVEFADVGCGFGGLSIALAPLFPETLMLGKWGLFSYENRIRSDRSWTPQVSRSACRSRSTSRTRSARSA